jgi:hypothetical protein
MAGAVGSGCWTEISISPEAEGAGARIIGGNGGSNAWGAVSASLA